jgi:aminopeptidase N
MTAQAVRIATVTWLALTCTTADTPRAAAQAPAAGAGVHHALHVTLDPATHRLAVVNTLRLPAGDGPAEFLLNARLRITKSSVPLDEVAAGHTGPSFGINADPDASSGSAPLTRYRLRDVPADRMLTVAYAGTIDFGLSDEKEQYTRGFRQTAGLVSPEGVYLAGASFWYPHFGEDLVTFEMTVRQPRGWQVISQGSGISRDEQGRAHWISRDPMDEIYLVGGPLLVYQDSVSSTPVASGSSRIHPDAVETLVYLRKQDDALASKYLATTAQYIQMYSALIGPYPYDKFALVENFWETGYGMPSFTLLGPEVIRFPFILHSSYPHEILHNWWGNSVFVDYGSGNWAEGLTAYLADHLVQEQRRRAADHRRAALQKYRAHVRDGRDFALTDFRSRDSAATEAVGYGKTMMTFHMLRRQLGDERFTAMLQALYRDYRGRRASWADVERVAQAAASDDLDDFFAQWTTRVGAPALELRDIRVTARGVTGTLAQTQEGPAYTIDVPVVVQDARGVSSHVVAMTDRTAAIEIAMKEPPLALHVDPYFDLFRRLDPRETPPSISQIFGEPRVLAVLPSRAPAATLAAYRGLLKSWETGTHRLDVRLDSEVRAIPPDTSVWLLGRDNALAAPLFSAHRGVSIDADGLRLDGQVAPASAHTAVAIVRHPASIEKVVGWIVADPLEALPGLGRKLPHYGRYSYVAFQGTEPDNTFSGEWRQADSPLRVAFGDAPVAPLPPDPATALAELPPVFSSTAMMETVATLTAPSMEGRGAGTQGLEAAAAFIAERFRAAGLEPGGDGGTYFQRFTLADGPGGKPAALANVVGVLRGARPDWKGQSAVIGAHYDHLGRGWPDVRAGEEGRIHAGADDNASGVAVLLELARAMAAADRPSRTIVFVAFSGEEARLAGSRHYVSAPPFPLDGVIGMINLDTVGRLFDGRVSVIGTGTAAEWPHIFRGASFVTGVESRAIPEALESSDHTAFIERGVPAVQLFTGAHADYHRPGDTADKLDPEGLVKVALLAREGIAYLGERPDPLGSDRGQTGVRPTSALRATAGKPGSDQGQTPARRVSLGTVPDFAFPGPGVRAEAIVEGSPAERAGLAAGDILLKVGDRTVANLQDYSTILRALEPGATVPVVVRRGERELTIAVTLVER